MIRIREIDHLVLRTEHPDEMIAFYTGVLGMAVERRLDGVGLIQLRAGNSIVDLVPVDSEIGRKGGAAPGEEGRNLDHFCLRVDPFDEGAIREHLGSCGVDAGPTEQRYGAEGTGPSIYIQDPDGNTVELKGPADPQSRLS
jgi:catechol 2,3-dioxygenase-like lactoylglutathione lyase family enzyme